MAELFYTWKQPSANGSALFEKEPMKKIETFLDQARKKHAEHLKEDLTGRQPDFQMKTRQLLGNQELSQSNLLIQVDKLLGLTQQRQSSDPSDTDAVKQINILNQLKVVLGSQKLPDNILPDIQQKLIGFTNKEMERLNEKEKEHDPRFQGGGIPTAQVVQPAPQFNRPNQQAPLPNINSPFTAQQFQQMANIMSNLPRPNNNYHAPQGNGNRGNNLNSNPPFNLMNMIQPGGYGMPNPLVNQAMPYSHTPVSAQNPPHNPMISSTLINSLMTAGLLSGGDKAQAVNPLFADIELTSSSLSKPRPNLIRLLYDEIPKSCSTCGKRFPDTTEGHKTREAHLDWHFRVNKKLREENWTQMRCWYLTQDDWIKYRDEEEILGVGQNVDAEYESDDNYNPESNSMGAANDRPGSNRSTGGSAGNNGSSSSKKAGKIDYEGLQAKYVLVPSNKHLALLPCPICKDKFSSVWNDEVEDWVWMNAVEVKGRIFHATCYAETEVTGGDLIKRILSQQDVGAASGGSRGSTPVTTTVSAKPAAAPPATLDPLAAFSGLDLAAILSNAKRKRDDGEDEGSRPSKKEKSNT